MKKFEGKIMDSTYLHRGKRLDNEEWIVGYYTKETNGHFIIVKRGCWIKVDPITVGKCTGLSAAKSYRGDKPEDKLVFEGDICEEAQGGSFVIKFIDSPRFYGLAMEYLMDGELLHLEEFSSTSDKIIGTVHDKDGVH